MMLYEYESKEILKKQGLNVPFNAPVKGIGKIYEAFAKFNGRAVMKPIGIKKRGNAGLIRFVSNSEEAKRNAIELLSVSGVKKLIREEKLKVERELYLSSEGGVGIGEEASELVKNGEVTKPIVAYIAQVLATQ